MTAFKQTCLALMLTLSGVASASAEPFSVMTCREIWPLDRNPVKVRTSATSLTLTMKEGTFSLPISRCAFSAKQAGQFACKSAFGPVRGIGSRFFKERTTNLAQFLIVLETGTVVKSKIFTVQRSNIDGFGHPSECMVDNEHVYVR